MIPIFQMMLRTWNLCIFETVYELLKDKTMILVKREREGEVFDSQLVIGVRQSFGKHLADKEFY